MSESFSTRRTLLRLVPWLITALALIITFRGIEWSTLSEHLSEIRYRPLTLAILLTGISYLCRAQRWRYLLARRAFPFLQAYRVLIAGFLMNNMLPARAGEIVRAHLGARALSETRTRVLASIAAERLVDGATISAIFGCTLGIFGDAALHSPGIMWVACFFGIAAIGVIGTVALHQPLVRYLNPRIAQLQSSALRYIFSRIFTFIDGLRPLCSRRDGPLVVLWSLIIWSTEVAVFYAVGSSFGVELPLSVAVLFMVAVNFSGLIPAAPGGIGVIEVIATAALMSAGLPREQALCLVLTQHAIQYAVVGIPGVWALGTWRRSGISLWPKAQESEPAFGAPTRG